MSAASEPTVQQWIEVAKVGRPFGVNGAVHLQIHNPQSALWRKGTQFRVWQSGAPAKTLHLMTLRPANAVFVATFVGVSDRQLAVALTHALLQVAADDLPPADDDEVYVHQIIGAQVFEETTGALAGQVVAVVELAQTMLQVRLTDGGEALVPIASDAVVSLGRQAGKVVVHHLADWHTGA